jgi:hypothetical protein
MFIYAIGNTTDKQKIGISKHPEKRLTELQTGNPDKLYIHYSFPITEKTAYKFEATIHREINYKRINGEWFTMTPEEVITFLTFQEIMCETIEATL